jgi:FkbM family methyltransferase
MKGEYIYTWINDSKFIVSPGETGLTGNLYFGLHEFEDMSFLLHYLDKEDTFVDIGANVGSYSILAGVIKGCTVHSFEPIPSTFKKLKRNIDINLNNIINIYNVGLGEDKSELFFTNNSVSTINHAVFNESGAELIKINVETLDSYNINANIIKIDVEGFEYFVLKGGYKTLINENLKCIIIELNESCQKYGKSQIEIFEHLISLGFKSYSYNPFMRNLKEINKINPSANNTLLIRGSVDHFNAQLIKSEKYLVNGLWI